ncbi:MAG: N-acetylmuramoyl-L-alanine amidase [Halobacteriovoraceae bacterium]|nr:N-acetylmuramoyl-L-alanine amidase [Halobacteriovoraceae bacterium]
MVLIDPGHGGEDLGAETIYKIENTNRYKKIYEKDFTLIVAKKIGSELSKFQNVYYTRTIDREVGLDERAEIADKVNADIFISIHFNSHYNSNAHGLETYFLSNKRNSAVEKIESIENKDLHGKDLLAHKILIDLIVNRTTKDSKELAHDIHINLAKKTARKFKLKDRGIRGGLFYVLAMSKRPAVLLEVGFISNPKELKLLMSESFLNDYAQSVVKGIRKFLVKKGLEGPSLF